MNDLRRELAPLSEGAWKAIEDEARGTLQVWLAARKLVDFEGPLGWQRSAVSLGRAERAGTAPAAGVEARVRKVQPLVELRVPFELSLEEIDDVARGAGDPDLDAVIDAAQRLACGEDGATFYGYKEGGIRGIAADCAHDPVALPAEHREAPEAVSEGIELLREAGVSGPFALALGPRCYTALSRTTGAGGYPVLRHVTRLVEGPVVWAPAVDGALLLSRRGGDFLLSVGRDASVGYLGHDGDRVRLYLESSFTFRLLGAEAAVPLVYTG